MKNIIKKAIVALGVILIVFAVIGFVFQTIATKIDRARHPMPGQHYQINGQSLHLICYGEKSTVQPSVIIESGMGNSSLDWHVVMESVAATNHICTYDRPGLGWSEPSDSYLTYQQTATNFAELLHVADIEPPYVLVGHSIGGIMVRDFAQKYPDDVVGMVLVDSSTENQMQLFPDEGVSDKTLTAIQLSAPIATGLSRFGLMRMYHALRATLDVHEAPATEVAAIARRNEIHHIKAMIGELLLAMSITDRADVAQALGDMPLQVLEKSLWMPDDASVHDIEHEQEWHELQVALAALSTRGYLTEATLSSHNIMDDQPGLVVDAIHAVLNDAVVQAR